VSALVSFGGGVNSTAMLIALANDGWRGPVVFSDTGCEWPETYCFLDYFEDEWMRPRGLELTRLSGPPYQCDQNGRTLIDYCEQACKIPIPAVRWCTMSYKVRPVSKWAEECGVTLQHIGIAADERHRAKKRAGRDYPLVERDITRQGCVDIIQAEGLDVPQKSGCYICPFQRIDQWRELWRRHPELFERAAAIEASVDTKEGRYTPTLDPSGRYTLRDLQERFERQMSWLDDSEMDELLAYKPCVCGI